LEEDLTLVTDEKEYKPGSESQSDEKLAEELDIGTIKLDVGIPFMYEAWGIRYRLSEYGEWRIAQMVFGKKSDAESWMKEKYLSDEVEGSVVPVKRCLLLTEKGDVKSWVEAL